MGPRRAIITSTSRPPQLVASASSYEHPQPHACFIQGVKDDLVNEGGIMDLWVREARLFKYGSGTGSNFSKLRGENEKLAGGGKSSGLMSFLKIGDRAAGAIKSGGTTRRAAKMVVVDADHPDIEAYIDWKVREEDKVAALVAGSKVMQKHLRAILKACVNCQGDGDDCFNPEKNPNLKKEIKLARRSFVPDAIDPQDHPVRPAGVHRHRARVPTRSTGTARPTSPSPGRTPTIRCASPTRSCAPWRMTSPGDLDPDQAHRRQTAEDAVRPRRCGRRSATPPGHSADPGPAVPHDHQRLAHLPRRRRRSVASNPCSEYMFLDDTACNLASLNLHSVPPTRTTKRIDIERL